MLTRRTALMGGIGLAATALHGQGVAAADDELAANKKIAKRYIEAFNSGDFAVFDEIVAEDFTPSNAEDAPGRDALIARSQALVQTTSGFVEDLTYTIDTMTAEADRVVVRGETTGTHDGRNIAALYFLELVVKDGQIQTSWSLNDTSAILGY